MITADPCLRCGYLACKCAPEYSFTHLPPMAFDAPPPPVVLLPAPRKGDWMETYPTRTHFYPQDPRPEEIHIQDIAHALSRICRFGGHTEMHYSVAQHSVLVSELLSANVAKPFGKSYALWGLLHDAAEAYVGDMIRPLKQDMPAFSLAEAVVMAAICERFGLPPEMPGPVKWADETLLATEVRDVRGGESAKKWTLRERPMRNYITPLEAGPARSLFLARFLELTGGNL